MVKENPGGRVTFTWVMLSVELVLSMERLKRMFWEPASMVVFGAIQEPKPVTWPRRITRSAAGGNNKASLRSAMLIFVTAGIYGLDSYPT